MFLADTTTVTVPTTAVIYTLDGVTTVLVLFMFVCLVVPSMVRNRTQFYAAMTAIILIILLHTLTLMFSTSTSIMNLASVFTGFLQLLSLILFVLCVGGLTAKELAGDMAKAYEVLRRGETEKEIIIPIGDQPRRGKAAQAGGKVYKIEPTGDDEEDDMQIPLK